MNLPDNMVSKHRKQNIVIVIDGTIKEIRKGFNITPSEIYRIYRGKQLSRAQKYFIWEHLDILSSFFLNLCWTRII